MTASIASDSRLDPRLRQFLEFAPTAPLKDVTSREDLLAEAASPEAVAGREAFLAIQDACDAEGVCPQADLVITTEEVISEPDANTIKLRITRPESTERRPVSTTSTAAAWPPCRASTACTGAGRSSSRPTASPCHGRLPQLCRRRLRRPRWRPFPAGLNDCVSGLHWVVAHAAALGIDPARIVVAGESGGGNLTLATGLELRRDGDLGLVNGLYALCPYIAGQWPAPGCPSSIENEGILLHLHNNRGAMGYGIEAFNERNPLRGLPSPALTTYGLAADGHQRQRVRPAAGRRDQLLPAAPRSRRPGTLPSGDGHHARHGDLRSRLPRHQRDTARDIAAFAQDTGSFDVGNDESGGRSPAVPQRLGPTLGAPAHHHSAVGSGRRRRSRRPRRARDHGRGVEAARRYPGRAAARGRSTTSSSSNSRTRATTSPSGRALPPPISTARCGRKANCCSTTTPSGTTVSTTTSRRYPARRRRRTPRRTAPTTGSPSPT